MRRRGFLKGLLGGAASAILSAAVGLDAVMALTAPVKREAARFDRERLAAIAKEVFEPSFYQTFEAKSFFMRMVEEKQSCGVADS